MNLDEYLRKNSETLTALGRARLAFSVIAGLYAMHRFKIVSRDVKPDDFLVCSPDGKPLDPTGSNAIAHVIDLGTCVAVQDPAQLGSLGLKHHIFVSPEVAHQGHITEKADVYSYGAILFFISSREYPRTDFVLKAERQRIVGVDLICRCRDAVASRRPSSLQILEEFRKGNYWLDQMDADDQRKYRTFMNDIMADLDTTKCEAMRTGPPASEVFSLQTILSLHGENAWEAGLKLKSQSASGQSDASLLLAVMYHRGLVFDRDDVEALSILSNDPTTRAEEIQDEILSDASPYTQGCKSWVDKHLKEAYASFMQGVRQTCELCATQLGMMMFLEGVEKVEGDGIRMLELAVKMGSKKAAYFLATHGNRTEEFMVKAAEMGHIGAIYDLLHRAS
jgi:serine/threonine protein kinase